MASKARFFNSGEGDGSDVGPTPSLLLVEAVAARRRSSDAGSLELWAEATCPWHITSRAPASTIRRSGFDDAEIGIDLILHIDLDVGLGAGFNVRIIFGEVHPAEIQGLELFCRKSPAIRLLCRSPAQVVE